MTARMVWTGGGAMLVEGVNILEGREVMTIKGGGGPNDTVESGATAMICAAQLPRARTATRAAPNRM